MEKEQLIERKFGMIVIRKGFATRKQVDHALALQKSAISINGELKYIGDILVDQNIITNEQKDAVLKIQRGYKKKDLKNGNKAPQIKSDHSEKEKLLGRKFGMIAIRKGFVTRKQVDHALALQRRALSDDGEMKYIGDILVDTGVITDEQKIEVLSIQKGCQIQPKNKTGQTFVSETKPLLPEEEPPLFEEELPLPEEKPSLNVTLSMDKTKAFICPTPGISKNITLNSIKELLKNKNIQYGIVDDSVIIQYISQSPLPEEPWNIAKGVSPIPRRKGGIKYYFSTGPGKGEVLKDYDFFTYRRLREKQQVKKGDIIAEKVSGTEGEPGIDVFGNPVLFPEYDDLKLATGIGTRLSEDGSKVMACVNGIPEISKDGDISVFPILNIAKDVGSEDGDVEFDGHIEIEGAIQEGVCIKSKSLVANEIFNSEINVSGDIIVNKGICEGRIRSMGNLMVKHILKADIKAVGNIVIENEAIDSSVETGGEFIINKGKIRSSVIGAKKGIVAMEIGSDASSPCILNVGFDYFAEKKIAALKQKIMEKEEKSLQLQDQIETLEQQTMELDEKIARIADQEVPVRAQQVSIQKEIDEWKTLKKNEQIAEGEKNLEQLNLQIDEINETVENLFNDQEKINDKITNYQTGLKNYQKQIAELNGKIEARYELSTMDKGKPEVKVFGTIFAKNVIKSPQSKLTLEENYQHVMIKEIGSSSVSGSSKSYLKISKLN